MVNKIGGTFVRMILEKNANKIFEKKKKLT